MNIPLIDKQLFDEDTGNQWYLHNDVKQAVLEFEKELEFKICSDDFNHNCNPNYEEVLNLVKDRFKEIFGDFEK